MSHKLPKSDNKLHEPLTEREQEILRLLAERYRDREIAQKLHLALKTVKWYNSQIYSKLGVNKRNDAVKKAQELGLLDNANKTTIRHNLPAPMTLFIGREPELTDLSKLLNDPNLRLLTLLAPGGMGKTRLALELAHHQLRNYPDGVFFVPLAPLSSSEHVTMAIADALDLHLQGEERLNQQLKHYLHDKKILLILDNFEHLLEASSNIAELLEVANYVKVLATSREKLALSGEKVYSVRGMVFSDWETPEDALEYDAVRLFMQGATLARSEFELETEDLKYLARICSLTEGMPLALILSATWVDVLSLEEIAHEIQANFDFLAIEMRDMPRRQWGIRAVFDPTWKRLTPEEQAVFMKFSTFRGGCTREAAQTITGATLRQLQIFINKALLTRTAEERYEIHELLRQYAEEKLLNSGKSETVFNRHSEYYANFMHNRENDLKGHRQAKALAEIEADLDNVHVAWDWAIERQDYETVERALECLCWFWFISFRSHEGDIFFRQSLTKTKSPPDESLRLFHAKLISRAEMIRRANLAQFDDPNRTRKRLQTSLTTARQFSNQHEIAFNLMMLGWLEMHISKPADVHRLLEESLALFTYLDDSFYAAWVLHFMASARQGSRQARILYKQAINLRRGIGDQMGLMSSMNNLTNVEIGNGNYAEAESLIHEMHKLAEKSHAPGFITTNGHFGSIYAFQGHLKAAPSTYVDCIES